MTSYYPTGVTHAGTPRRQNPFLDSDSEDEDESIGVDSIATESVVSLLIPVGNIQEEFEAAVKEGFDFDGEFAVCKRYAMGVAPNPCLEIDGLGTVGLPLSERDARAIISACKPARLPSGNTKLSGIWEMSAEKIHLDNPAWDTWIEKTAGATASRALGAVERARKATPWAAAAAPATFAARKLVIHEAGSSGATHVGRADATDKIGDLIVILPGRHDGGQLQFCHAGASTAFNSAPESGHQTTIIASYTGVTHTLSSITSGYRLSIVYDIHEPAKSGGSRGSSLPEMHTAHERLRTILRSWKEGASDDAAPKSLVCLLQNKYHKAPNFSADSLTAGDALLVSHLRPVAREFGFRILLGHIDYDVAVEAQAPAEGDAAYEDDYWGAGIRKRDQEDYRDTGESSTYINFTLVVDLGGMPVGLELELHPEDLLNGSVTDMPPDRKVFDREDRYEATRTSVYNRTVLLLWPKDCESDCKVTTGDVFDYASMKLKDSITSTPTRREKLLVKNLLVWCTFHHPPDKLRPAMQVLLAAACRWNDSEILSRALKAGKVDKNIDILGADCLVTAIGAFGWDTLKDFCDDVMKNDKSNERRDALLGWLTQMAAAETNTDVSLWCSTHEEAILRSLPKLDANQIPTLVDRSLARGGDFLRDVIFPQLHAQKLLESTWVALLERLHQASKPIHIPPSTDIVKDLVAEGVADRVRKWSAPEKTVKEVFGSTLRFSMSAAATFALIKFCVATEHAEQCITLFSKIREAVRLGHFPARFPPSKYYSVLFKLLMEYMKAEPGLDDMFQPFFVDLIDSILFRPTAAAGKVVEHLRVEDSVATIVVAGRKAGGIPVLSVRLTADALVGCDTYTLQGLARAVMKEFPLDQCKDPASLLVYTTLLTTLVHAAIDAFPNSLLVKPRYQDYTPGVLSTPEGHMMHLVKLCFEANLQSECSYVLARFLPASAGSTLQQHVSDVILPFLPKLARYLAAKGLDLVSDPPYNIFVATAVKTFAEEVMGEKPYSVVTTAQIQNVGCRGCSDCGELRTFLLSEETTTSFQRPKNMLMHLEQKLASTVAWGVTTESDKQGSARILMIVKPNFMTALSVWQANSKIGQNLLNAIGDTAAQMRVLGEDYNWVNRRIVGSDVVPMDTQP